MSKQKKSKISKLLHNPRFWSHLVQACGGLTGILALLHIINPQLIISIPAAMLIISVVNIWTENHSETATQVDDFIHLATDALLGGKDDSQSTNGDSVS